MLHFVKLLLRSLDLSQTNVTIPRNSIVGQEGWAV